MRLSELIKDLLRKAGFSVQRILPNTDPWVRRKILISSMGIDIILDIGAHRGNYGRRLRREGYKGQIYSFEPQPNELTALRAASVKSPPWKVFPFAISDFEGHADFFVSERTSSSSLQEMTLTAKAMADTDTIGRFVTEVRTIDSIIEECALQEAKIYAKCDVQGSEESILKGATQTLKSIKIFEVELSIGDMYPGQWEFREALAKFDMLGFDLFSLEAGFADPITGRVMQVDAIFVRRG